ncbi:GNAT family N-acetyltransferase [Pseudoalteromonas rubra]|uniref:GNAT family N-acetyltransferase n=1 Tax=Pseudoalteromonas rubra TaxID=43658 RepID=A0A5S3WKN2_9GAMM|nr:GNAT family N-acetyltransferase [Pseudoalteromonas rubra]TMP28171.1 GNAT family N-acetyltransferase [Pseudoalteromonas rubra]TMP34872.1 GNAT family N-acetyltransferase [Pseudoalteromonas rubra]
MSAYTISTDTTLLNFDVIYHFISDSYWAKNIPRDVMARAIDNSLCFGAFSEAGEQVGFARVITDNATFAYLADVFILEQHRGQGVSKMLVEAVMKHPELQGLRRIMLATKDAHGLYAQFGFETPDDPSILMQICQPDIYQRKT